MHALLIRCGNSNQIRRPEKNDYYKLPGCSNLGKINAVQAYNTSIEDSFPLRRRHMSLSLRIKDKALYLGFKKVGITTADDFAEYIEVLEAHPDIYAFYSQSPRNPLKGARPKSSNAAAKSIISVAYDFSYIDYPEKLLGKIGRIYQARCYLAPPSLINGARLEMFRRFLRENGCNVLDGILVPDRMAAAWGLGRIGGVKAKKVLEESLVQEKSWSVRREIASAQQKLQ